MYHFQLNKNFDQKN
jgi:hypothetical protein